MAVASYHHPLPPLENANMTPPCLLRVALVLGALLLTPAGSAYAQCGMGIPGAGNPGCIPPDVLNQQNTTPQQQPRTIIIRHKWADRWGAISLDGIAGSLGFVTGYPNKRSAEKAAVRECVAGGGGRECKKIEFVFHNSCAAFILGKNGISFSNANDEDAASRLALKHCEDNYGNCRVYKTGCSHAEAVPMR